MILVVKSKKEKEQKRIQEESQHEDVINEIMAQGYEREEVLDALRSSNFDRTLALDYLENGYDDDHPNNLLADIGENDLEALDEIEFNNAIDDTIEHFLSDPEFRDLREQIRNDPGSVDSIVEQVRDINPTFHQILVDNPDIVEEIVDGVIDFDEDELEDEDEWEDVDENAQPMDEERTFFSDFV